MKVKKLFKIFPRVERTRIIDTNSLKELYSGDMGHLPIEFLNSLLIAREARLI